MAPSPQLGSKATGLGDRVCGGAQLLDALVERSLECLPDAVRDQHEVPHRAAVAVTLAELAAGVDDARPRRTVAADDFIRVSEHSGHAFRGAGAVDSVDVVPDQALLELVEVVAVQRVLKGAIAELGLANGLDEQACMDGLGGVGDQLTAGHTAVAVPRNLFKPQASENRYDRLGPVHRVTGASSNVDVKVTAMHTDRLAGLPTTQGHVGHLQFVRVM